jgi:pseudouridine-5'-phosphate glycosidase
VKKTYRATNVIRKELVKAVENEYNHRSTPLQTAQTTKLYHILPVPQPMHTLLSVYRKELINILIKGIVPTIINILKGALASFL